MLDSLLRVGLEALKTLQINKSAKLRDVNRIGTSKIAAF